MGKRAGMVVAATVFVVALGCSTKASIAANTANEFVLQGVGGNSCGAYTIRDPEANIAYLGWMAGYISAFNAMTPALFDLLKLTDFNRVWDEIGNYCKHNPTTPFGGAVKIVLETYYAKNRNLLTAP